MVAGSPPATAPAAPADLKADTNGIAASPRRITLHGEPPEATRPPAWKVMRESRAMVKSEGSRDRVMARDRSRRPIDSCELETSRFQRVAP